MGHTAMAKELRGRIAVLLLFFQWVPGAALAGEDSMVSGITEPVHDVVLSSEVGGTIAKINAREGDIIAAGAIILELDNRFEELEVKRCKLVWNSKVEMTSANDRAQTLKDQMESAQTLSRKSGSVSTEEMKKQEQEYKLAVAEYHRLKINEVTEAIEYEMAVVKRDKLILKTPIDGIIADLFLDEGEPCEPRQPLVRVVDTRQCLLVCNIEATLGGGLKNGQPVALSIPSGEKTLEITGTLRFVSPVVDPATGLMVVKAVFDNPDGRVKPGVPGSMKIPEM